MLSERKVRLRPGVLRGKKSTLSGKIILRSGGAACGTRRQTAHWNAGASPVIPLHLLFLFLSFLLSQLSFVCLLIISFSFPFTNNYPFPFFFLRLLSINPSHRGQGLISIHYELKPPALPCESAEERKMQVSSGARRRPQDGDFESDRSVKIPICRMLPHLARPSDNSSLTSFR